MEHMTAFFHVAWCAIYGLDESQLMNTFHQLKFKMKLGYECWRRGCELPVLILEAINTTLNESMALSTYKLQKYVNLDLSSPIVLQNKKSSKVSFERLHCSRERSTIDKQRKSQMQVAQYLLTIENSMQHPELHEFIMMQKILKVESFGLSIVQFYEARTAKKKLDHIMLRKSKRVSIFNHL